MPRKRPAENAKENPQSAPLLRALGRRRWIYWVLGLIGALLYAIARVIPS